MISGLSEKTHFAQGTEAKFRISVAQRRVYSMKANPKPEIDVGRSET